MHLEEGKVYHVFNRGNNKQTVFFSRDNYLYFLKNVDKYLSPCCDTLSWCLMPNHFHLLVHANENSTKIINDGSFKRQQFSQSIKQLLSSYTKAINKQRGWTGSLFQQKTKAICVDEATNDYATVAFHYIHQNPMKSSLTSKMEDWEFSSFQDYIRQRDVRLCNINLAAQLLNIELSTLLKDSYAVVNYKYIDLLQ